MNRNPYFQILPQSNLAMLAIFGDLAARLSKDSSEFLADLRSAPIPTIHRTNGTDNSYEMNLQYYRNQPSSVSHLNTEQNHSPTPPSTYRQPEHMNQTNFYHDYVSTEGVYMSSKNPRPTSESFTNNVRFHPDSNHSNMLITGSDMKFHPSSKASRQESPIPHDESQHSPPKGRRNTNCELSSICPMSRKRRPSGSILGDDDSMDRAKRHRTSYTQQQVQILEQAYRDDRYISRPQRTKLASELNLSESTIKVWFQNRRMKEKRQALMLPTLAGKDPYLRETLLRVTQLYYASRYGIENHLTGTTSSSSTINDNLLVESKSSINESCAKFNYSITNIKNEAEIKASDVISPESLQEGNADDANDEIRVDNHPIHENHPPYNRLLGSKHSDSFIDCAYSIYHSCNRSDSQSNIHDDNSNICSNSNPFILPFTSPSPDQSISHFHNHKLIQNAFGSVLNLANTSDCDSHQPI